jgi:hypothetical protein
MTAIKIPYDQVAYQVEVLYQKEFAPEQDAAITKHCEFIAEFIRACGWTEDEYFERWMKEQDKLEPILPERNINLS